MTVQEIITREAFEKGYTIDKDGVFRNDSGEILPGSNDGNGYLKTSYYYNGKRPGIKHNKFQAFTKYGDKAFEKGIILVHLNGDKSDSSYDNIILTTRKDLHKYKAKKGPAFSIIKRRLE